MFLAAAIARGPEPLRESVVFAGISILSAAVGLPLASRRVRPNRWYGLRIPATFADEHVWYEANAALGRDLVVLGCVLLAVTLALAAFGASPVTYAAACGSVFGIGSLVALTRGWRLANRLRAARLENGGEDRPGAGVRGP